MVDDFGDAVALQWRCPSCLVWHDKGKGWCGLCKGWIDKRRRDLDPVGSRERKAARRRALIARDPLAYEQEKARVERARQVRRARDPERERALSRARNARYRERLRADPARHEALKEAMRIDSVIRRQSLGLATGNGVRRLDGTPRARRCVSAAPLAWAVEGWDFAALAERAGVSERLLRAWRNRERRSTWWDTADRVLLALDRFWWEVFDPACAPAGLFSGERSRDLVGWLEAALTAQELWGDDD